MASILPDFSRLSIDDSENWWKTFLEPLNEQAQQDSNVIHLGLQGPSHVGSSLIDVLTGRLQNQHLLKTAEKEEAVAKAKKDIESLFQFKFSLEYHLEPYWKAYEKALKMKSDLESTGSAWTIQMLARYIKREDIEFIQPEQSLRLEPDIIKKIVEKFNLLMEAIGGQIRSECDTRMVLDAILQPVCFYKGSAIRTEQTIKCHSLPTNRYDYIMYYNNQPIGVVEAKRPGCLIDKSVAQLIVQLLLLSAMNPRLGYFGVLSDGFMFIFAGVTENKVIFFQEDQNCLEFKSVKNLKAIIGTLLWHIERAIWQR